MSAFDRLPLKMLSSMARAHRAEAVESSAWHTRQAVALERLIASKKAAAGGVAGTDT